MLLLLPVAALSALLLVPTQGAIPRACSEPQHQQLAFCNASLSTSDRVEDLLSRLPLDEKVTLLTARASPKGNMSSIGLPEYNCGTNCATSFPNPVNLGAIFDPQAVFDMAQVIGWELRALWLEGARENYAAGPHLGLDCWSPNININRDPRWGRNMETPSEDPLVNSKYGVAYTRGLQEGKDKRYLQAVVTLKHYAAYSYEHYDGIDRMAFNAFVSRYDFADTYLPAFEASVVQGKAKGVMCSYNSVNGMPMCANEQLNTKLLREALGFDGYITSDSGAIEGIYQQRHYTKSLCEAGRLAILSGTDVNSGSVYKKCLAELVTSGQLPEKAVDDAMRRTLKLRFELGLFDPIGDQPYWHVAPSEVNTAESKQLSLGLTRKSLVLLQNHGNILPLSKGNKLAVIGPHAKAKRALLGNYLGQMCHGDYLEVGCVQTPLEAIATANGAPNTVYAKGSGINDTSTAEFDEAEAAAREADAVVLFLGIDTTIEREAWDRENIDMPNIQMQLLKRVRRVGKPTVVVLLNGGVVGIEELILHTDGVVEAFYPGFFGAQAVADVLFGDAVPSGKLPVTMYPSNYINSVDMKSMSMTKYPGRSYRYYKEVPVFPFGWGLSYTKFTLALDGDGDVHDPNEPLVVTRGLDQTVSVILSNDGDLVGDEVVLAFFRPLSVNATGNAALLNEQLFDYRRVSLRPTQYRKLSFRIDQSTLAMVDDNGNQASFPGFYEVILTNGVHERVTFAIHLVGEYETLNTFPTDEGYVPPAQAGDAPVSSIQLDATRAFKNTPVHPSNEQQSVAVAMAFD
jgi:beta-D-xylosidase 4